MMVRREGYLCWVISSYLLFSRGNANVAWSPSLIMQYFSANNVYFVDAFVCSQEDGIELMKYQNDGSPKNGEYSYRWFLRVISKFDEEFDVETRVGIFVDLSCDRNNVLLAHTKLQNWLTTSYSWLLWDSSDDFFNSSAGLSVSVFSQVVVQNRRKLLFLKKFGGNLPLKIEEIGTLNSNDEVNLIPQTTYRIDLQKTEMKAVLMFTQDIYNRSNLHNELQDSQFKPGIDVANRFTYGNAQHLAYLYNFTLAVIVSSNWGDRSANGTWSGMVGYLQRQEADIAISLLLPLAQRVDVSYPLVPHLMYWMAIVFKQPRALGTYRAMIIELSPSTWIALGAAVVLSTLVFTVTRKYVTSKTDEVETEDKTFAASLFHTLEATANQGLTLVVDDNPSRIVGLSMLILGFLVSTYYNAATMTALLSESPPLIKSLDQLMTTKDLPLTAPDAAYVRNKNARHRVFRPNVEQKMDQNMKTCSLSAGVQSILNGSGLLGESFALFQAINADLQTDVICDLTTFNAGYLANTLIYSKKCPHYRELFIRGLLRTKEHGLMTKERQKWITERLLCSRTTQFIHVQLEAVSLAVGVLTFGVILSAVFLVYELYRSRKRVHSVVERKNEK